MESCVVILSTTYLPNPFSFFTILHTAFALFIYFRYKLLLRVAIYCYKVIDIGDIMH
jgi:hypothetical protein